MSSQFSRHGGIPLLVWMLCALWFLPMREVEAGVKLIATLEGSDGTIRSGGELRATRLGEGRKTFIGQRLGEGPQLELSIPDPGLYQLTVAAVGYAPTRTVISVPGGENRLELQAALVSQDSRAAVLSAIQEKQLLPDFPAHPVLEARQDPALASILRLEDVSFAGKATLVFDKSQLEATQTAQLFSASEAAVWGYGARVDLQRTLGPAAAPLVPYGGLPARFLAVIDSKSFPLPVRQAAAISLLQLAYALPVQAEASPEMRLKRLSQLLDLLPPSHPLWTLETGLLEAAVRLFPHSAPLDVLEAALLPFTTQGCTREVQAEAFRLLYNEARFQKRDPQIQAYYAALEPYADLRRIQVTLRSQPPSPQILVGSPMPDFELKTLDGVPVSRSSLLGKVYLVDVWATWCGACVLQLPDVYRIFETYTHAYPFTVLSLSMDNSTDKVLEFQKKQPMPWLNAFIGPDPLQPIARLLEVGGLPSLILVDATGKIVATGARPPGRSLEDEVRLALQLPPLSPPASDKPHP